MKGVGLFLWMPAIDGKKEYMLQKLQEAFQEIGVEVLLLDISSENAFEKLGEIDKYFSSLPPDKKRFVFSIDGDGFGLTLRMDGLWVDNIQYNVFTYLTRHPREFSRELSGINSWYISILNCCEEGVAYIEENYPHLDGIEYMEFPALTEGGSAGNKEEMVSFAKKILDRCK